jgi:hypothetical protein
VTAAKVKKNAITNPKNGGVSIVAVSLGSPEFDQVLILHKGAREYLGFLPDQGFKDRAEAGTLLVAKMEGNICGYVLYDPPADRVTIRHLCVTRPVRVRGSPAYSSMS